MVIGSVMVSYALWVASGQDGPLQRTVMSGVTYERVSLGDAVGHLVTVELDDECVRLATSPVATDGTARAAKTITWAQAQDITVAVNAGFFFPYDQAKFWDVYPAEGEEVTVLGPVVRPKSGVTFDRRGDSGAGDASAPSRSQSAVEWNGHALWFDETYTPAIGPDPATDAILAVGGRTQILTAGIINPADAEMGNTAATGSAPYPRTVVGVNPESQRLWLLVVDGRQPGYSDGLTLADAAAVLRDLGATDALELDGGGSSTMVIDSDDGPERISRPIQIRIPGRSRAVANNFGIAAPNTAECRAS